MLTDKQITDIAEAWTKDSGHFEFEPGDFMECARSIAEAALLSDRLAAIDKQGTVRGPDGFTDEIRKHRHVAYAEGYADGKAFATEASKPAPSVEQDERGADTQWEDLVQRLRRVRERSTEEAKGAIDAVLTTLFESRAASTSANVAQGAEAVAIYQVQTGDCWLDMTQEQYDHHSKTRPTRIVYAAPPVQPALTDDAREKMISGLEAEKTYLGSSRDSCSQHDKPRWDRLQAVIDHLSGGA